MDNNWEKRFPSMPWREPLPVRWTDRDTFSCRICIADFGLTPKSEHQWPTMDEVETHLREKHPHEHQ